MEFSKKILIVAGMVNVVLVLFTLTMVAITRNLTPLNYLITTVAAETATGTAFYYNKAKKENEIKIMHRYGLVPKMTKKITIPIVENEKENDT